MKRFLSVKLLVVSILLLENFRANFREAYSSGYEGSAADYERVQHSFQQALEISQENVGKGEINSVFLADLHNALEQELSTLDSIFRPFSTGDKKTKYEALINSIKKVLENNTYPDRRYFFNHMAGKDPSHIYHMCKYLLSSSGMAAKLKINYVHLRDYINNYIINGFILPKAVLISEAGGALIIQEDALFLASCDIRGRRINTNKLYNHGVFNLKQEGQDLHIKAASKVFSSDINGKILKQFFPLNINHETLAHNFARALFPQQKIITPLMLMIIKQVQELKTENNKTSAIWSNKYLQVTETIFGQDICSFIYQFPDETKLPCSNLALLVMTNCLLRPRDANLGNFIINSKNQEIVSIDNEGYFAVDFFKEIIENHAYLYPQHKDILTLLSIKQEYEIAPEYINTILSKKPLNLIFEWLGNLNFRNEEITNFLKKNAINEEEARINWRVPIKISLIELLKTLFYYEKLQNVMARNTFYNNVNKETKSVYLSEIFGALHPVLSDYYHQVLEQGIVKERKFFIGCHVAFCAINHPDRQNAALEDYLNPNKYSRMGLTNEQTLEVINCPPGFKLNAPIVEVSQDLIKYLGERNLLHKLLKNGASYSVLKLFHDGCKNPKVDDKNYVCKKLGVNDKDCEGDSLLHAVVKSALPLQDQINTEQYKERVENARKNIIWLVQAYNENLKTEIRDRQKNSALEFAIQAYLEVEDNEKNNDNKTAFLGLIRAMIENKIDPYASGKKLVHFYKTIRKKVVNENFFTHISSFNLDFVWWRIFDKYFPKKLSAAEDKKVQSFIFLINNYDKIITEKRSITASGLRKIKKNKILKVSNYQEDYFLMVEYLPKSALFAMARANLESLLFGRREIKKIAYGYNKTAGFLLYFLPQHEVKTLSSWIEKKLPINQISFAKNLITTVLINPDGRPGGRVEKYTVCQNELMCLGNEESFLEPSLNSLSNSLSNSLLNLGQKKLAQKNQSLVDLAYLDSFKEFIDKKITNKILSAKREPKIMMERFVENLFQILNFIYEEREAYSLGDGKTWNSKSRKEKKGQAYSYQTPEMLLANLNILHKLCAENEYIFPANIVQAFKGNNATKERQALEKKSTYILPFIEYTWLQEEGQRKSQREEQREEQAKEQREEQAKEQKSFKIKKSKIINSLNAPKIENTTSHYLEQEIQDSGIDFSIKKLIINEITPDQEKVFSVFLNQIPYNNQLTSIIIRGLKINCKLWINFAKALIKNNSVTSLDLQLNHIKNPAINALVSAIIDRKKILNYFNISHNNFSDSEMLSKLIAHVPSFNQDHFLSLEYEDNYIQNSKEILDWQYAQYVVSTFAKNKNYSNTNIACWLTGNKYNLSVRLHSPIQLLLHIEDPAMKETMTIQEINIMNQHFSTRELCLFFALLQYSNNYQKVNFYGNQISTTMLGYLFDSLLSSPAPLKSLVIGDINISDARIFDKIFQIFENKKLTNLTLVDNIIYDLDGFLLSSKFENFKSLSTLNLSGTRLLDTQLIEVLKLLKYPNNTVHDLNLSHCGLGANQLKNPIFDVLNLETNKAVQLKFLMLGYNNFTDNVIEEFLKSLFEVPHSLIHLDFTGCPFYKNDIIDFYRYFNNRNIIKNIYTKESGFNLEELKQYHTLLKFNRPWIYYSFSEFLNRYKKDPENLIADFSGCKLGFYDMSLLFNDTFPLLNKPLSSLDFSINKSYDSHLSPLIGYIARLEEVKSLKLIGNNLSEDFFLSLLNIFCDSSKNLHIGELSIEWNDRLDISFLLHLAAMNYYRHIDSVYVGRCPNIPEWLHQIFCTLHESRNKNLRKNYNDKLVYFIRSLEKLPSAYSQLEREIISEKFTLPVWLYDVWIDQKNVPHNIFQDRCYEITCKQFQSKYNPISANNLLKNVNIKVKIAQKDCYLPKLNKCFNICENSKLKIVGIQKLAFDSILDSHNFLKDTIINITGDNILWGNIIDCKNMLDNVVVNIESNDEITLPSISSSLNFLKNVKIRIKAKKIVMPKLLDITNVFDNVTIELEGTERFYVPDDNYAEWLMRNKNLFENLTLKIVDPSNSLGSLFDTTEQEITFKFPKAGNNLHGLRDAIKDSQEKPSGADYFSKFILNSESFKYFYSEHGGLKQKLSVENIDEIKPAELTRERTIQLTSVFTEQGPSLGSGIGSGHLFEALRKGLEAAKTNPAYNSKEALINLFKPLSNFKSAPIYSAAMQIYDYLLYNPYNSRIRKELDLSDCSLKAVDCFWLGALVSWLTLIPESCPRVLRLEKNSMGPGAVKFIKTLGKMLPPNQLSKLECIILSGNKIRYYDYKNIFETVSKYKSLVFKFVLDLDSDKGADKEVMARLDDVILLNRVLFFFQKKASLSEYAKQNDLFIGNITQRNFNVNDWFSATNLS